MANITAAGLLHAWYMVTGRKKPQLQSNPVNYLQKQDLHWLFSLGRFKYILYSLLTHGHAIRVRISRVILYFAGFLIIQQPTLAADLDDFFLKRWYFFSG